MKTGGAMADGFTAGFKDKVEKDPLKLSFKGLGGKKDRDFSEVLAQSTAGGGGAAGAATGAGTGAKKSTSLTGVKSGRPTHINIDIGKLIENFNITTTNMEDTTNMVKDKIAQTLMSAVNNVNNIAR
jgi:hypothetical protein